MNQRKPNRLINEKSPYLLQHAYNPVDWFAWGEEAFEKARTEDKPIFLSIGYSTCYWCHVMEREVFENESIAALMNETVVSIKVDREERPDVDRIYMSALQATTGSGGWPLSAFLAPDLKPFYTATYIRPVSHHGRPGFPELVTRIGNLWRIQREKITQSCDKIFEHLTTESETSHPASVSESIIEDGYQRILVLYDAEHYGFGNGPKFPRPVTFNFLLRYFHRTGNGSSLKMVLNTLRAMARGGIYDHLGGGFHRYSVDTRWRLPHFEKMLYDQAQIAISYLEAYQITHEEEFHDTAKGILRYCLTSLQNPDGGFYSAEDAESITDAQTAGTKEEGAFYLWTKSEIDSVLETRESEMISYYFGIEGSGNIIDDHHGVFVGKNVLFIAHGIEETARKFGYEPNATGEILQNARTKLFHRRRTRPHPHRDEKIITAWNGLMVSALATAYNISRDEQYLREAQATSVFIMTKLYDPETRTLFRRYCDGEARYEGGLQDYAFVIQGFLDLYEAAFDHRWLETALILTRTQLDRFRDLTNGGFYETPLTDTSLLIRMKDDYDGAEPAGNSIAALNLLRLGSLTGNNDWRESAERVLTSFGDSLTENPEGMPQLLVALLWYYAAPREIIFTGFRTAPATQSMLAELHRHFLPCKTIHCIEAGTQELLSAFLPFLRSLPITDDVTTAYICRNHACQQPVTDPDRFREGLER